MPTVQNLLQEHNYYQKINEQMIESGNSENDEQSESDSDESNVPVFNTLLDSRYTDTINKSIIFAPGEGKKPMFTDPETEYLCFPSIFAGKTRPTK